VARELQVDAVLVGTFELADDRMLTTLSLVDAKSGLQSWADEFEEPFEDVFDVQRRIALGAARSLKQELSGDEETALAAPESRSAAAYDQYMQGAHIFQQGTEEATAIAFQYFSRAVDVDPELSEAHMALGAVHYARYVYGWGGAESLEAAERNYMRALELDPQNLRARRGLILLGYFRGQAEVSLAQGQLLHGIHGVDETERLLTLLQAYGFGALPERLPPLVEQMNELDAVNAEVLYFLAVHTWAWAPEEAIAAGTRYFEQFGDDPDLRDFVAFAHIHRGELDAARRNYDRGVELVADGDGFSEPIFFAGFLYDRMGQRERAQELWRKGLARIEPKVASHPDNLRLRVFEACFHGLTSDTSFLLGATDDILSSPTNAWELQLLAAVLAYTGYEERAVEVLRASARRGLPDPYWVGYFAVTFAPHDGPGYRSVMDEIDVARAPLREKY
jgi:tetratricopeptide (TPR) repeat protein